VRIALKATELTSTASASADLKAPGASFLASLLSATDVAIQTADSSGRRSQPVPSGNTNSQTVDTEDELLIAAAEKDSTAASVIPSDGKIQPKNISAENKGTISKVVPASLRSAENQDSRIVPNRSSNTKQTAGSSESSASTNTVSQPVVAQQMSLQKSIDPAQIPASPVFVAAQTQITPIALQMTLPTDSGALDIAASYPGSEKFSAQQRQPAPAIQEQAAIQQRNALQQTGALQQLPGEQSSEVRQEPSTSSSEQGATEQTRVQQQAGSSDQTSGLQDVKKILQTSSNSMLISSQQVDLASRFTASSPVPAPEQSLEHLQQLPLSSAAPSPKQSDTALQFAASGQGPAPEHSSSSQQKLSLTSVSASQPLMATQRSNEASEIQGLQSPIVPMQQVPSIAASSCSQQERMQRQVIASYQAQGSQQNAIPQQASSTGSQVAQQGATAAQRGPQQGNVQQQDASEQPSSQRGTGTEQAPGAARTGLPTKLQLSAALSIDAPLPAATPVIEQTTAADGQNEQADDSGCLPAPVAGQTAVKDIASSVVSVGAAVLPDMNDAGQLSGKLPQARVSGSLSSSNPNAANGTAKGKNGSASSTQSDGTQTDAQPQNTQADAPKAVTGADRLVDAATTAQQSSALTTHPAVRENAASHPDATGTGDPSRRGDGSGRTQPEFLNSAESTGTSGINSARLIQAVGETEMRVGMHSLEFGDISIRTSVTQQQMVTQISVDHGALGAEISSRIPSMQEKLGSDHGMHASIQIEQSGSSLANDNGRDESSQREQKSSFRSAAVAKIAVGVEADRPVLRAPPSENNGYRLDIRA
jgi:hypothetical protein